MSAQSRNVLFPQSRNVLTNAIAEGPFPSYQKRGSERRGAVKGARLLRGEREPLTASTVLDNEYRGKGGFPPSASTSTKQDISTLLRQGGLPRVCRGQVRTSAQIVSGHPNFREVPIGGCWPPRAVQVGVRYYVLKFATPLNFPAGSSFSAEWAIPQTGGAAAQTGESPSRWLRGTAARPPFHGSPLFEAPLMSFAPNSWWRVPGRGITRCRLWDLTLWQGSGRGGPYEQPSGAPA